MGPSSQKVSFALAALGVISHLAWFVRMQPLKSAPKLAFASLTVPAILTLVLINLFYYDFFEAARTATLCFTSYVGAAFASMLVYRVLFHPLRHYPGPFGARLTQWYHVVKIWNRVDHFRHIDKMHQMYGEYVRVGPNLLSISDPDIVNTVHAPLTKFDKSDWYDIGQPLTTLSQMRDRAMHDKRRRHGWDKAFTAKALRSYDSRIVKYTNQLVRQLRQRSGEAVDARTWINWFSFDVMGDLVFGKSFEALEKGQSHFFIDLIHDSGLFFGRFNIVPWVLQCIMQIPIPPSVNSMFRMLKYSNDMVEDRKTYKPKEPDVMSHLLKAGSFFDDPKKERLLLMGDARLLIVAGSDTTATTLTFMAYHIARDPSLAEKLRAELCRTQHLCHPPVPGGVYRDAPAEGITVNGHYIPGGTVVVTPHYTIQRSPKAFAMPNEFIPERWTSKPELILDKSAWFPFVIGRYGCIGKQLAMDEMRTVIAKVVLEFNISFAKGEDGRKLLEDSHDTFTTACAKLDLVFTARE